ncbi:MAG: rod shape-determining protein RodA [Candidatus Lloydbacteria bacterium CG22_combo_CG10-13_8_21_14_all_47_15]|uniref:Rod shape-determining protein RodA n=1 Tax=Candidatus Lloydbacteria bacterium CG22_combo_CG10-13_8_21_14_all_47_15 TaxID=1974635 RepID=A0A2H0CUS8_9BACT|nr:MAG: rod shape-determining protein RodA [Candidatus Lloydbacteria bacterium CG22_combo_CG10-13_8_21_14_all_47_15]
MSSPAATYLSHNNTMAMITRAYARAGIRRVLFKVDWPLFIAAFFLVVFGLITMNSFVEPNEFFNRQIIWTAIGIGVFFTLSLFDFRILRRTEVVSSLFFIGILLLILLLLIGDTVNGTRSWFTIGPVSFQPSDMMKLILIIVLAKYFSRRHIEISHFRHIFISGIYAAIPFFLIAFQPDFGSALIIASIWFGMIIVSGVSKKHLLIVILFATVLFSGLWQFGFEPYQKVRILSFMHPLADVQGAGYHARQSMIAVGSGEIFGKGIGYGTQSRLKFLPEYQTDFIFAAFAEEWGFVGAIILFMLYGILIWRILAIALVGSTNFEMLFAVGLVIFFMSHIILHIGINVGLFPVTGTTVPFLSYGGSHIITEFAGLGILMGMSRYARPVRRSAIEHEMIGI